MTTVKKKYSDLFILAGKINEVAKDKKNKTELKLAKIAGKLKKYYDEFNEKSEDLRLDHASVDKENNLLLNEKGGYIYTKEAIRKLTADSKALFESEFDFEVIEIINPEGLEDYPMLDGWVNGVKFKKTKVEDIEDVEL